jgi:transglutaminase-like putative cysteine protease
MNGKYYIPLPSRNLPYQDASYEITNCAIKEIVDSDMNSILYCIPNNSSSLKIISSVKVKNCDYRSELSSYRGGSDYPPDIKPFLGSTDRINPNSSAVITIARQLKTSDNIETINNTLYWIKKNITYKREGFSSVDEVLHRRYAECGGHSALFSALCRANNIPAREVWGVVEADISFTPVGHLKGHLWSEVYLNGVGWIPVEPQILGSLGKLPRSYIRMYSYEPFMHITGNYNEAYNIYIMDGDKPLFTN